AKDHEAELRGFVRSLAVNKVLVVLVGEISKAARTRLRKEVGATGDVFDLPWLVDQFTEHYPQVFFDGRAVDFLDGLVQKLEQDAFYAKAGKTLSECFVEPVIAMMDAPLSLNDADLTLQLKNKRVRLSQLSDEVVQRKRVLLVGDPGSGKSKAVTKICIDGYRQILGRMTRSTAALGEPAGIPVMITARELVSIETSDALCEHLLPQEVRGRFKIETLIVDGLDEVFAEERTELLQKASAFCIIYQFTSSGDQSEDCCAQLTSGGIRAVRTVAL